MNNFENTNQTKFAFEEPIYSDVNVSMPVDENELQNKLKKSGKKKKLIIVGVVIFVIFLLLILVFASKKQAPIIPIFNPEATPEPVSSDPFKVRIENARAGLEIADPANQDLTFPPVDMKMRLDKKER